MTKSWIELMGRYESGDHVFRNEIVRPTKYFTTTDFGKRRMIWQTLWIFDSEQRAKEVYETWKVESK